MRAVQIVEETGPDSALRLLELEEPEASHMLPPGEGVVVDVHAAGVSFPEVLQTRGMYQVKPPLPFVPGSEFSGVIEAVGDGVAGFKPGDRVAALAGTGGFGTHAIVPADRLLPLPAFLREGARLESRPSASEIADGFRLTGFFLARDLFASTGAPLPDSRAAFLSAAAKANLP